MLQKASLLGACPNLVDLEEGGASLAFYQKLKDIHQFADSGKCFQTPYLSGSTALSRKIGSRTKSGQSGVEEHRAQHPGPKAANKEEPQKPSQLQKKKPARFCWLISKDSLFCGEAFFFLLGDVKGKPFQRKNVGTVGDWGAACPQPLGP